MRTWKTGEHRCRAKKAWTKGIGVWNLTELKSSPLYLHSVRRKRFIKLPSAPFDWSEASVVAYLRVVVRPGFVVKRCRRLG
jgi:hypothetical protein